MQFSHLGKVTLLKPIRVRPWSISGMVVSLVALYFCAVGSAFSMPVDGLLGLNPGFPQVDATGAVGQGAVYDSSTRTLTITSTPTLYFPDSNSIKVISDGLLRLIANVNMAGEVSGGSLIVTTKSGGLSDPLMLGQLLNFGLEDTNAGDGSTDLGDFLFEPTGGAIVMGPDWPMSSRIGATVTFEGSTYGGSLDSDWISTRAKFIIGPVETTAGLPEPPVLQIFLLGLAGIYMARRQRQQVIRL